MSRHWKIFGLAAAALLLVSCEEMGEWGNSNRYKEDFHYSYPLKAGGRISLENLNGSVEVIGQDQDKVEITGTKYASTEQVLKAIRIDIASSDDSLRIRTVSPSGHRGNHGARYVLRVPRRVELERIGSSNGGIRVEGVDGSARLRTSNGSVKILRLKGNVELDTSNGPIELNEHTGSVIAHTSNGSVRAEDVRGYFEAITSNGSIHARLSDPEPNRPVKLESSNGSVTLAMDAVRNNDVRVSTSNSSITLQLPASLNAQVRAHTSNSSIQNDFDVTTRGTSKNSLEGTIGTGGPLIDVSTSNGRISLQKL